MKKGVIIILLALFLISFVSVVSAMKGPVTVQTEPGNRVKIYAWIPNEKGQSLYEMKEGIADENGQFEATFFSLNDETVEYQIRILNGLIPLRDNTFENWGTLNALIADCTFQECVMSVDESWTPEDSEPMAVEIGSAEEETGTVVETETISDEGAEEETTVTTDSSDTEEKETTETSEKEDGNLFSGLAIFTKNDGSPNWFGMSIFGVVLILVIGAVFMFIHRGRNGSMQMMSGDERELRNTERRAKEVEDEIRSIKEKRMIKERINNAKKRLAEEERELKRLMGDDDTSNAEIEDQKQAVEDAKDELEEHKSNL